MANQLPNLLQSLQGHDLGHLRIVAELWNVELEAPNARTGLQRLAPAVLDRKKAEDMVAQLPEAARNALEDLLRSEGRLPWSRFTRRHGVIRELGPGRRDRERPHLNPSTPAEMLWYRALVARAFFDTETGPEEFAYIPADLLDLLSAGKGQTRLDHPHSTPLGRPASQAERAFQIPASDRILDHACTLLATLRLGLPIAPATPLWQASPSLTNPFPLSPAPLQTLLSAAGLLDSSSVPLPEPTRAFLEASRGEALAALVKAWLNSTEFNELRLLPGLSLEGQWQNDPKRARNAILDFLSTQPGWKNPTERVFWNLASFLAAVRNSDPDFQRPAGDYDSWYIREASSGEFLRGYEHWDEVDGALIRFTILGPLHWLGLVDLASPSNDAPVSAFRLSAWANSLLAGKAPQRLPDEAGTILANSNARLRLPQGVPRSVRYQIARFSSWGGEKDGVYTYHLTPAALERARQQGLRVNHLLALLRRHAGAMPPSLVKALERWEERGVEARMERVTIIRLSSPELMQALRGSRAARFLGDPLGPTTVVVKPGAAEKVLEILSEMGFLGEAKIEPEKD